MNKDELEKITKSIQEKLGEENSAIIADDLGLLITQNENTLNQIDEMNKEINILNDTKEKLIMTNGNLLKQIPVGINNVENKDTEEKEENFSFYKMFDKNGKFIK